MMSKMTKFENHSIAKLLRNVAATYAITNPKKFYFQMIAYQKASDIVEGMTVQVYDLWKENKIDQIPGIGKTMQEHLIELFTTGKATHFENIFKEVPESVFILLDIPTFGPKKAYKLVKEFNLINPKTVISDVKNIAKKGEIAKLEGFGEKSQTDIIRSIDEFKKGAGKTTRMVLPYASEIAEKLINYLKENKDIKQVNTLGSLRRMRSTVGDLDISVASSNPKSAISHFLAYPYVSRKIEEGPTTASVLLNGGAQVDLMVQPPDAYGALLQHFTGSKAHNIKLREFALKKNLSLSEYGIRPKTNKSNDVAKHFDTEEKFYNAIGLDWIPPELREDTGEVEFASKHSLPTLVELKNIKGDLHIHSSYPIEPSHDMGNSTMETMLTLGKKLGYEYIGFSEHNPSSSKHTKTQVNTILKKRFEFIEQLNSSNKYIRALSLLETDILPSGKLAIDGEAFDYLDAILVSIHSVFSMNKKEMTKRVLEGLSHKKAKILTHPTGRLLTTRPGYELDFDEIFTFCKKFNKAIEINSWPQRLDLPDTLVKEAISYGVQFVINTDSHDATHMNLMKYGVSVARRGWATKHDILNTLPYNKLIEWIRN